MIISASRRTDIPAFYSDWFIKRIQEGFVLVRNPVNAHQVSRIRLSPDVVDCIVFWTKNPAPMMDKLSMLRAYPYYFQFTLNAYGQDVEPGLPPEDTLVDTFITLSDAIGRERVIWRYDPILVSPKYGAQYHVDQFGELARSLKDHTDKCVISFIDFYRNIGGFVRELGVQEISDEQKRRIAKSLAEIAALYGLGIEACAEDVAMDDLGIGHARCIDDRLISRIIGSPIKADKDKNQRLACGCVASIDIGLYNTCRNGCKYCYANHSVKTDESNTKQYDVNSPLLCSQYDPTADTIHDRPVHSFRQEQICFF